MKINGNTYYYYGLRKDIHFIDDDKNTFIKYMNNKKINMNIVYYICTFTPFVFDQLRDMCTHYGVSKGNFTKKQMVNNLINCWKFINL